LKPFFWKIIARSNQAVEVPKWWAEKIWCPNGACILGCILVGEIDPSKLLRPKIAKALAHNEPLLERIRRAKSESGGGQI
jgi:hypothetical protein